MNLAPRAAGVRCVVAAATVIALFASAPHLAGDSGTGALSTVEVKAALLYNFAKFAEWPSQLATDPIALCVVDDEPIAGALAHIVRDKSIDGHPLAVQQPLESGAWRGCEVLFIADQHVAPSSGALRAIKTLPVLTVSDGKDFSQAGGMIEFYLDRGRMRFRVNLGAVERSGLRLSSRLLGLATITHD